VVEEVQMVKDQDQVQDQLLQEVQVVEDLIQHQQVQQEIHLQLVHHKETMEEIMVVHVV
jgi:hypothetical protein